jgi:hypothetical protein
MELTIIKVENGYVLDNSDCCRGTREKYIACDLTSLMQLIEELIRAEFKVEK